jgi:glycosyltransferase involved in cell wall biosynthesis
MHNSSDRKKILFVSDEASLTGAPIFLYRLLQYLQKNCLRYKVVVHFARNGPLVQALQQEGFETVVCDKRPSKNSFLAKAYRRFEYYLRFIAFINQQKPDLVYSNTIVNFSQVVLARLMGYKVLVHVHEGNNFIANARHKLKLSSFFTSKFVVGSQYVRGVLSSYVGRDGLVIYNGINTPDSSREALRPDKQSLVVCMVGTVDRNKAQLLAIKAIEHVIRVHSLDVQLAIAGRTVDREYEEELRSYIREHDLDHAVALVGPVENIEDVYINSDALVVSSYDEVFPTVILEAMAFQKPVVASNTGGIPEIVEDGVSGLLFEKGNAVDLANKIASLFDNDLRLKLISNAHLKVRTRFAASETNKKIVETIDCVLNSAHQ